VALPASIDGARRAITRRHAAHSVAPVVTTVGPPCVIAWLGARAPGIHRCHQEDH